MAWINEMQCDNLSADVNEGIEVAGTPGGDLTGWTVALHNGSNGSQHGTDVLSGSIDHENFGLGEVRFAHSGIKNAASDCLALIDDEGSVVQFLSIEGTMTASDGPAAGLTSEPLGVSETSSTGSSHSLQLEGTGPVYADFVWASPQSHSRGWLHAGQTMGPASVERSVASDSDPDDAFDLMIFPNPMRNHINVARALTEAREVTVEVYDSLVRRVASSKTALGAGFRTVPLDVQALPAGAFVVCLAAGRDIRIERLTVVR